MLSGQNNDESFEEHLKAYDKDYNITYAYRGSMINATPWHHFNPKWSPEIEAEKVVLNDKAKVHVSIKREQLEQAQKIIMPILSKYRVKSFKLLGEDYQYTDLRNVAGKELTIYMQHKQKKTPAEENEHIDESNPDDWIKLLNELEDALQTAGIQPNDQKSQGDIPFPGTKGYTYFRHPHNALGFYVAADLLKQLGFTNEESCHLKQEGTLVKFFEGKALHNANVEKKFTLNPIEVKAPLQTSKTIDNNEVKKVYNQYNAIIASDVFFELFFGREKKISPNSYSDPVQIALLDRIKPKQLEIAIRFKKVFEQQLPSGGISNFFITKPYREKVIEKLNAAELPYNGHETKLYKLLNDALNKAANLTAGLREKFLADNLIASGDINPPAEFGNIAPAIYHQFFLPYATAWRKYSDFDIEISESELISAIVKCSFRKQTPEQIVTPEPFYIGKLNDKILTNAIIEMKQSLNIPVQATYVIPAVVPPPAPVMATAPAVEPVVTPAPAAPAPVVTPSPAAPPVMPLSPVPVVPSEPVVNSKPQISNSTKYINNQLNKQNKKHTSMPSSSASLSSSQVGNPQFLKEDNLQKITEILNKSKSIKVETGTAVKLVVSTTEKTDNKNTKQYRSVSIQGESAELCRIYNDRMVSKTNSDNKQLLSFIVMLESYRALNGRNSLPIISLSAHSDHVVNDWKKACEIVYKEDARAILSVSFPQQFPKKQSSKSVRFSSTTKTDAPVQTVRRRNKV